MSNENAEKMLLLTSMVDYNDWIIKRRIWEW